MGAFENAIREQETFESLLKLYKESRGQVAKLEREVEGLREDKARLDFLIEEDGAITHSDGKCSVHFGSGYAACFNDAREAIDAAKEDE